MEMEMEKETKRSKTEKKIRIDAGRLDDGTYITTTKATKTTARR